jgi:hypothetical protein
MMPNMFFDMLLSLHLMNGRLFYGFEPMVWKLQKNGPGNEAHTMSLQQCNSIPCKTIIDPFQILSIPHDEDNVERDLKYRRVMHTTPVNQGKVHGAGCCF